MKYLSWLFKAAIFFTLFAFSLNNQQTVSVYFFFGTLWKAPLVVVVLATFSVGVALGVLLMMPRWWSKRRSRSTTEHSTLESSTLGADLVVASASLRATGTDLPTYTPSRAPNGV